MVNHNVKTCKQPPGTSICGPCCVKMGAQYFGVKASLKTVEKYCNCTSYGSLETSLVIAINKMGLKGVLYAIPSGGMFFGKYVNSPKGEVVKSLKIRAALTKDVFFAISLREAAQLIEQDLIKFELATRRVIERELDKGNLWITCCLYYILGDLQENEGAELTHFILIQGYTDKHFIINDPLSGVRTIDKDRLLCAIYSTSPYEVSTICVSKV